MVKRPLATLFDDCLRAIAGADAVRTELIGFIEAGACGLLQECYAIKSRTKDPESLERKVLDRREKGKPEYAATDARDIVGIRLLSLHYANMRNICRKLIEFFEFALQSPVGLFVGTKLDDMIEEVIVYESATSGLVYQDILSYLQTVGLGTKPDGTPKVSSVDSPHDRPYSSIHIVCHARGSNIEARPFVPIEIQVRTTLEDTWAEIDHTRKYKAAYSHPSEASRSAAELFNAVKDQVDSALSLIDKIIAHHDQIEFEESRRSLTYIRSPGVRLDVDHKIDEGAPPAVSRSVRRLNNDIAVLTDRFTSAKRLTRALAGEAEKTIARIDRLTARYSTKPNGRADRDFLYWSQMERAFISIWLYKLSKDVLTWDIHDRERYFDDAIGAYSRLETHFPKDAWLRYRYATALMLGGLVDLAIEKAAEAFRLLPSDPRIRGDGVLKAAVARQLSFMYWSKKQSLWDSDSESTTLFVKQQERLLLRAFEMGAEAFSLWRDARGSDAQKEAERYLTIANLASFAWELRNLYGVAVSPAAIPGFAVAAKSLADEVVSRARPGPVAERDSIMKVYSLLGEAKAAKSIAGELRKDPRVETALNEAQKRFLWYCIERI